MGQATWLHCSVLLIRNLGFGSCSWIPGVMLTLTLMLDADADERLGVHQRVHLQCHCPPPERVVTWAAVQVKGT